MIEDEDYTFEDKLIWLGQIDRCEIACGSYGDQQWEIWCKSGKYVEFEEHEKHLKVYKDEVARLQELMRWFK